MKRLIISICTLLLLITSLYAHRESIVLTKSRHRNQDERSIPIVLSAYQNGSTIIFYSSHLLKNLQITIKNTTGQVIFEKIIFIFPQQPYTFSLINIEDGVYTLELNNGQDKYYGYFEIMQ